jgi:hypothetical protein
MSHGLSIAKGSSGQCCHPVQPHQAQGIYKKSPRPLGIRFLAAPVVTPSLPSMHKWQHIPLEARVAAAILEGLQVVAATTIGRGGPQRLERRPCKTRGASKGDNYAGASSGGHAWHPLIQRGSGILRRRPPPIWWPRWHPPMTTSSDPFLDFPWLCLYLLYLCIMLWVFLWWILHLSHGLIVYGNNLNSVFIVKIEDFYA